MLKLALFAIILIQFALAQTTLSGTCPENSNVRIYETELDAPISQIRWVNGSENKIIYALTNAHTVYQSTNDGETWTNQNIYMQYADVAQSGGLKGVRSIITSANEKVIYFFGYSGLFWVTTDDGKHYTVSNKVKTWNALVPHPTEESWLLADASSAGCSDSTKGSCYTELFLSQDYGSTWSSISTYVYQYTWGSAGTRGVPKGSVWSLEWTDKTGNQRTKSAYNLTLLHSLNFGSNSTASSINNVYFMLYSNAWFYLAQWLPGGGMNLLVSSDDGLSFNTAQFPFDFLQSTQFTILDDTEGSAFINVRHTSAVWGHVYSSDSLGSEYDLSLPYNWRDGGIASFSKIQGLDGIYFANQMQDVESSGGYSSKIKTLVTANKGGDWEMLPTFPVYRNGTVVPCSEPSCSLNLHIVKKTAISDLSYYGPFYSKKTAIGLIFSTGNVGEYLENMDKSDVKTYRSRDAGQTWTEILDGSYLYDWVARGSISVFASNTKATNTSLFSFTEGQELFPCTMTSSPIEITDIKSDPSETTLVFLVYGHRKNADGTRVGVVVQMDFTGVIGDCKNPDDYESWTATDYINAENMCLNGEEVTYARKKLSSVCIASGSDDIVTKSVQCPCASEDYECDFCFTRVDGVCSKVTDGSCQVNIDPPADCVGYYPVTQGYRLVPGNKCDPSKGLDLLPKSVKCPSGGPGHDSDTKHGLSAGAIAAIVLVVVGIVAVIALLWGYNKRRKESFEFSKYFPWNKAQKGPVYDENFSTALDEDLLEEKEAEPFDDDAIDEKLQNP